METEHNPDMAEAHLPRLLAAHSIEAADIADALNLTEGDIQWALHPSHWLELSLVANACIRREIEARLHTAGWRGETAELWQAHRDAFINHATLDEDLQE